MRRPHPSTPSNLTVSRIERIGRSGPSSHRRTVYIDGQPAQDIPVEVLRELGVAPGDDVDLEAEHDRLLATEREQAWQRSLRLLRYRGRGSGELSSCLRADGYRPEVVESTIEMLVGAALLDDEASAHALARTLVQVRGYGRSRALRHLRSKGFSDEIAEDAVEAAAPLEEEGDRALAAARSLARPADTAQKLASRLVRRGYPPGLALRSAEHVLGPESGEQHPGYAP